MTKNRTVVAVLALVVGAPPGLSCTGGADPIGECAIVGALTHCDLATKSDWPTEVKLSDHRLSIVSEVALSPSGLVCTLTGPEPSARVVECSRPGESSFLVRTRREVWDFWSLPARMTLDKDDRVRVVWPEGDYARQRVRHAIDDGPAETVYEGEDVGAIYAIGVDALGRSVVAFSTGGRYSPNREPVRPYTLRIAIRVGPDTWQTTRYGVPERTGAASLILGQGSRWLVWKPSDGGYGHDPDDSNVIVDLDGGREVALPIQDAKRLRVHGGWIDSRQGLNLMVSQGDVLAGWDLLHLALAKVKPDRFGDAESWSMKVVQRSRKLPDRGDVSPGSTFVGDQLQIAVDVAAKVHVTYLETNWTGLTALVFASLEGDDWMRSALETWTIPTQDRQSAQALPYIYGMKAGPDGVVSLLVHGHSFVSPEKTALLVIELGACVPSCVESGPESE